MREVVSTKDAPQAIGPYSQATKANGFVFTSGQIAIDPSTQQVITGDIAAQTERVLRNLSEILEAAGSGLGKVVSATVFLKDIKDKTIRSYTTDAKGHFRFTQVNMAEDHELWAEKDGKKTQTKTVSSWDTRKEFETELKMK